MVVVDIVILSVSNSNCPRFGPHPTHTHTHTQEIFLFSRSIEMSSGCTLSCVHWESGVSDQGIKLTTYFHLMQKLKWREVYCHFSIFLDGPELYCLPVVNFLESFLIIILCKAVIKTLIHS